MKMRMLLFGIALMVFTVFFLFQGTQQASSSPMMRITLTPSPTVPQFTPTTPATLPPPITNTNQPLIPVTGTAGEENMDLVITGGMILLVLGVAGMAWPEKRKAKLR